MAGSAASAFSASPCAASGLVAAGGGPLLRFLECRNAGRVAADLALGGGVLFARGIGPVLRFPPARAGFGLRRDRRRERGFGRFDHAVLGFDFAAGGRKFALDRCSRPRSARRRAAPVGACAATAKPSQRQKSPSRDTSRWPGLSVAARRGPAERSTTPIWASRRGQFRRCFHKERQRRCAFRQRRIGRIDRRARPAHRRRGIDRRIEIVAESGAERLLVTLGDVERVGHRRPQILVLDRKELADGLGFGLQPLHAAFGGGERSAGGVEFGARLRVRYLRCSRGALRFGEFGLRGRERRGQNGKIGLAAAGRGKAGIDVREFGFQPFGALRVIVQRRLKLIALRRQIGERPGQLGKRFLRDGQAASACARRDG